MDCRKSQENLWEYQASRLPEGLRMEMDSHLEGCEHCRSLLESLKLVDAELDRFGEVTPSPYFDQKLNVRLEGLPRPSRFLAFLRLLKQPYVFSFAFLFLATVGIWMGIRHQQAAKLKSIEDVMEVQDKYLGTDSPRLATREDSREDALSSPNSESKPAHSSENPEPLIPEEDRALVENIDLLENYDLIKKLDLADSHANASSPTGMN